MRQTSNICPNLEDELRKHWQHEQNKTTAAGLLNKLFYVWVHRPHRKVGERGPFNLQGRSELLLKATHGPQEASVYFSFLRHTFLYIVIAEQTILKHTLQTRVKRDTCVTKKYTKKIKTSRFSFKIPNKKEMQSFLLQLFFRTCYGFLLTLFSSPPFDGV